MTLFALPKLRRTVLLIKSVVYVLALSIVLGIPITAFSFLHNEFNFEPRSASVASSIVAIALALFGMVLAKRLDPIMYRKLLTSLLADLNLIHEPETVLSNYCPFVHSFHIYNADTESVIRVELDPPKCVWAHSVNYIEYVRKESGHWKLTYSFDEPDEDKLPQE